MFNIFRTYYFFKINAFFIISNTILNFFYKRIYNIFNIFFCVGFIIFIPNQFNNFRFCYDYQLLFYSSLKLTYPKIKKHGKFPLNLILKIALGEFFAEFSIIYHDFTIFILNQISVYTVILFQNLCQCVILITEQNIKQ